MQQTDLLYNSDGGALDVAGLPLITTPEIVQRLQRELGDISAYRVAKELGVVPSAVYRWKHGNGTMADGIAARAAELLGDDPAYFVACVAAERATDPVTALHYSTLAKFARAMRDFGPAATAIILALTAGLVAMPDAADFSLATLYTLCAYVWITSMTIRYFVRRTACGLIRSDAATPKEEKTQLFNCAHA